VAAELADRDVAAHSFGWARLALSVIALVLFGSVLVTITLIYVPALVLVVGLTSAVRSTATKGTVRVLVGLVAGVLTWVVAGIVLADGDAAVVAGALVAVGGLVALLVWTPVVHAVEALIARVRLRSRGSQLTRVLEARDQLALAVHQATGSRDSSPGEGDA
jgi:hypothetical protein